MKRNALLYGIPANNPNNVKLQMAAICCLNYSFALLMIDNDERLKNFSGRNYDELIERFKETVNLSYGHTVQSSYIAIKQKQDLFI